MTSKSLPKSEHFTYHELADGVWAAIVITTGLAASNSGIVDLGDRTLIFDTTLSPATAIELRKVAESLTGRSVATVFNSHWHQDHVFGNAAFAPETEIYATTRTSEIIAEKIPTIMVEFRKHWPKQLKEWAESAKVAKNEAERLDYEDGVRFAQSIIDTFPQLELRLPDHTFTDRIEFKGSKRNVELITFGGGHTDSDAFLHLPTEKIIFTGDLLVVKNHPDLTSGHPREWLNILARIKTLNLHVWSRVMANWQPWMILPEKNVTSTSLYKWLNKIFVEVALLKALQLCHLLRSRRAWKTKMPLNEI